MNVFWLFVQVLATIPTLPRDIRFGYQYLKINRQISNWQSKGWVIHQVFDQVAEENANKIAIRLENEAWTFKELKDYSLRVANFFRKKGYVKGDVVGLLMDNHPQYVGAWLGLSRIGVITALLNTHIKLEQVTDAVTTATKTPCKCLIIGHNPDLLKVLENVQKSAKKLPSTMTLYFAEDKLPQTSLKLELLSLTQDQTLLQPIDEAIVKSLDMDTKMVYVYTSGTTGDPKAATFSFRRFVTLSMSIHIFLGIHSKDSLYTPMPMYHASGGMVGTGQMLLFGNTMTIKKKFSRSSYFSDCKLYGITVAQYIGEMCSYIYSMKPSKSDRDHKVRLMFGNGLRQVLWHKFKKRFNIHRIGEFYGSTEGNTNMVNTTNKEGAVGFMPWYASFIYPVDLIEFNRDDGTPYRGEDGLCIRARWEGLLVGGIKSGVSKFDGYANEKATNAKIIKDVFVKGDQYFNSGDVLRRDLLSYYYFVDRLGDNFRWKGENVAASQVETIITSNLGLDPDKVAVYGVKVPNIDGKAGMAAFAMEDEDLDKVKLMEACHDNLSTYQSPMFLRVTTQLPMTPTEKIKKAELQQEGFDPAQFRAKGLPDKLYYYDIEKHYYAPLTDQIYALIKTGKIKF